MSHQNWCWLISKLYFNISHLSLLLVNSTTCGQSKTIKIFSWVDAFSIGWCSGYHCWRDRGRSYQVFGPSLFGRIQPVWQGSLSKRNKQVSKPVQWRLMTPHCWFPCCDSSFAAGLGTFWCLRETTVCWRNGWNQFWNRCCWSRTLKWGWDLGVLFVFSSCSALCVKSWIWVTLYFLCNCSRDPF